MSDELGDRMKAYEAATTEARLDPHKPIYARIDGRAFSTYTRGMDKPFDRWMLDAMRETCAVLVEKTHARIGFVQSDEISLVWLADTPEASVLFDGKLLKVVSVLASLAASAFTHQAARAGRSDALPHFDCRAFNLPDKTEAANAFVWRWLDARKNGVRMVAQAHFSPKQLHGVGRTASIAMLADRGVSLYDYPPEGLFGTFVRRTAVTRDLSPAELARIPEGHRPTGPVVRTETTQQVVSDFLGVANREAFIFGEAA